MSLLVDDSRKRQYSWHVAGDAYLTLAEEVLEQARRPLSSNEIIERAYVMNLVPRHLHGKTQHKTLTARLSEDILERKDQSVFFRPYPGRYFLSKFIDDESLPEEYRRRIIARRRSRQLSKEYAAYLPLGSLIKVDEWGCFPRSEFSRVVRRNIIAYDRGGQAPSQTMPIWHFSYVRRGNQILSYTRGRYLDGRQSVSEGKTIGFSSPLTHDDRSLFEQTYHGVLGAAVSVVSIDLNLEHSRAFQEIEARSNFRGGFIVEAGKTSAVVLVCHIVIPEGFSVDTNRLAIKELDWQEIQDYRGRLYDYDLWSQRAAFLVR